MSFFQPTNTRGSAFSIQEHQSGTSALQTARNESLPNPALIISGMVQAQQLIEHYENQLQFCLMEISKLKVTNSNLRRRNESLEKLVQRRNTTPMSSPQANAPLRSNRPLTSPNPRAGHKRTETPEQRSLHAMMGVAHIHTVGMGPQNDRGLIADYVRDIKSWAETFTAVDGVMTHETFLDLKEVAPVILDYCDMAILTSDPKMRAALVAAFISRFIMDRTISEQAMVKSNHPRGKEVQNLYNEYHELDTSSCSSSSSSSSHDNNHQTKHHLLQHQKALFTEIKHQPTHKQWRTAMSERFSREVIHKLGSLVSNAAPAQRNDALEALLVRGYRIGFRLRMDAAVKYTIRWPVAGAEYDSEHMVFETRELYGQPVDTLREVQRRPRDHRVRFALSPVFILANLTGVAGDQNVGIGAEEKSVVHKALVHIERK